MDALLQWANEVDYIHLASLSAHRKFQRGVSILASEWKSELWGIMAVCSCIGVNEPTSQWRLPVRKHNAGG